MVVVHDGGESTLPWVDPQSFIRFLRIVLILAAVVLAAFPLLIILDLAEGGSGYGICPGGVAGCRNPYTAAPELMLILTMGLIVVLGGFRLTTRLRNNLTRRRLPPDR